MDTLQDIANAPPLVIALIIALLLVRLFEKLLDRAFQHVDEKRAARRKEAGDESAGDPAMAALLARFDKIIELWGARGDDHETRLRALEREQAEVRGATRISHNMTAVGRVEDR